ncbi:replication protein P [Escherichia coli]|nr:replication protein P [Escherichia coli]
MNNVFTAIQNRDGEALSRMSGYEHQYVNNDNVVNMSAERLVDALFKQLKQLFPAAVVTNLKTPEQEVAAKQQWIAAFAEGGIRTREQVSAGMRHARASESPFWPSPGQFIKWCKDSKMVLGVTIDDVMAEFHRYSKEKSLYPGGPERFPWRHPVMYWVVCDMEVSIDVSTCDADLGNRYFGTVTEALELDTAKNGYILLVQDAEPNFDVNGNSPGTPDGWISCSERMPDSKTAVLVAREFDRKGDWRMKWATYIPGHPDANDGWVVPGASWIPSHWMPLPEPPQEVNRG